MPLPQTGFAPPTAERSGQNALSANADAKLVSFIDPDTGAGILVSEDNPLPTTGGGGGGGDATAANQVLEIAELTDINTNTAATTTALAGVSTAANQATQIAADVAANALLTDIEANTADSLTDTQLRATPVPVSGIVTAAPPTATGATPTPFTSAVAAPILAASANRISALIYLPATATGLLHILWGAGTVSGTLLSYTLLPGAAYRVTPEEAKLAATAILTEAADTAFVTEFTV